MSILVDYILTLYPQQEFVNGNVSTRLQQCLISFMNKQISFDKAKSIIQSLNLSVDPLEKLNHILNIDPPPASSISSSLKLTLKLKRSSNQNDLPNSKNSSYKGSNIPESSDNDNVHESENAEESDVDTSDSKEISSSHSNRRKSHCWTSSEDERLLAGVHRYGLDNWSSVAHFVGNERTRSQCSQRWFRGIDPRLSKNLWTREEDNMLISLVSFYGDRAWTKISSKLGNRSDVQCRYHYKQIHKDFQNHTHPSSNAKDSFQKQQDHQQSYIKNLQDQQSQYSFQNQQPQLPIQNHQPQFQFHNQQSLFQNKIQDNSNMTNMNIGQLNQMNSFNNYNNLNGMNNCFPLNRMQTPINYNQMQIHKLNARPDMTSTPNSINGNNNIFQQQNPQMNMMNWSNNSSIQQPSFPSFSNNNYYKNCNNFANNSQLYPFQSSVNCMNTNKGINSACFQPMQTMLNPAEGQLHCNSNSIAGESSSQEISTIHEEEQTPSDTEASQFSSSDVIPKQSNSGSSSGNEPAIFELDDSDLFSKEAMTLFSMPGEKDYLFF